MLQLKINDRTEFTFEHEGTDIRLNGTTNETDIIKLSDGSYHVLHEAASYTVKVLSRDKKNITLSVNGKEYTCAVKDALDLQLDKMGISIGKATAQNELKAPMPGLVLDVKVKAGQSVKAGESLVVLEAMKMENILKASADVTIKEVKVKNGQNVEKNTVLVEFE